MNTQQFPYFANKIRPIKYYKYKSLVSDVFYNISYNTVGINDEFFSKSKNSLEVYTWFKNIYSKIQKKNKDLYICTNKIVFECLTEFGNTIFLGWYDGTISLGLGRRGDECYKEGIEIK